MNIKTLKTFFFLFILFITSFVSAKGLSSEEAENFLHDSGLTELISSLPDSMGQQLDVQRLSTNSGVAIDKTRQAVLKAAQKVDGRQIALVYLSKDSRAQELADARKFLASPLGQRISEEERKASTAEAQVAMQAYAQELQSKPIDKIRAGLVQDLSLALNADEVVIKLMRGVYYSVLDAVKVLNPHKMRDLKNRMDSEWKSMEPMLKQQFSAYMLMGANYSYRNLSDEDLKAYIQFLKSRSGQAYWQVGVDIIDLYIQGFVSELVTLLSEQR